MRQVAPLEEEGWHVLEPACGKLLVDCLAYVCPATNDGATLRACALLQEKPHSGFDGDQLWLKLSSNVLKKGGGLTWATNPATIFNPRADPKHIWAW